MWRAGVVLLCALLPARVISGEVFSQREISAIRSLSIDNRQPLSTNPARVALGRVLFESTRISPSGRSCATCHPNGGTRADSEQFRPPRARRSPALADVAWNRWYFWDGRATSLESAISEPLLGEQEVGASPETIRAAYSSSPIVAALFDTAAGGSRADRLTDEGVIELAVTALADYVRTLKSVRSRFDRFAESPTSGSTDILTEQELRGLKIFLGKGKCVTCHHGWKLSDGEFHNLRLLDSDGRVPTDSGRLGAVSTLKQRANAELVKKFTPSETANVVPFLTERGDQFGQFKTPSLRNLHDGTPLMHQGQFRHIRDAVLHYSEFNHSYPGHGAHDLLLQPLRLSAFEVDAVVAFLGSLRSERTR